MVPAVSVELPFSPSFPVASAWPLVEFFRVTAAGDIAPVKVDTVYNCLEGIYESER